MSSNRKIWDLLYKETKDEIFKYNRKNLNSIKKYLAYILNDGKLKDLKRKVIGAFFELNIIIEYYGFYHYESIKAWSDYYAILYLILKHNKIPTANFSSVQSIRDFKIEPKNNKSVD